MRLTANEIPSFQIGVLIGYFLRKTLRLQGIVIIGAFVILGNAFLASWAPWILWAVSYLLWLVWEGIVLFLYLFYWIGAFMLNMFF